MANNELGMVKKTVTLVAIILSFSLLGQVKSSVESEFLILYPDHYHDNYNSPSYFIGVNGVFYFSNILGLSIGAGYENHEVVKSNSISNLDVREINIALRTKFKVATNLYVIFRPGMVAQKLNGYGCLSGGPCKQNPSQVLFKLALGVRYDYKRVYSSLFLVTKRSHLDTFYFGDPAFLGFGLSIGYKF